MKASKYTIATKKETPADAEVISHQLMIRAGLIRKLAAGIYSWMPMGLRVLQKIENIVRQEMNAAGGQEVLLPAVQPAELWRESGRWHEYDDGLLLKFQDRHKRDFCFGPTHEEVITSLVRDELKSHKQLPVNYYQIQTKFRDETRPRFGVLRSREFTMKDAYSFHISEASLKETYQDMHTAYSKILQRMQLDFRAVQADTGGIGGSASVEFHVLAESGEDKIAFSTDSAYAANVELAEAIAPPEKDVEMLNPEEFETPGVKTIDQLCEFEQVNPDSTVKTLLAKGSKTKLVALVLRGDHQLNPLKAEKMPEVATPLTLAEEADINAETGADLGSIGPQDLDVPVLVDRSAYAMRNFTAGANKTGFHIRNLNWERDVEVAAVYDLRDVVEGDPSPDGRGTINFKRGIEVGHIFQLGEKYSRAMNATVLDDSGKAVVMQMGCYGMGVTRLVGAIIEQHHDDKGIVWPDSVAPFQIIMIPVNAHKSEAVQKATDKLYAQLRNAGIEVLLDDRESVRPGAKFADAELIGIPHRCVIGDRGLEKGVIEYVNRRTGESMEIAPDELITRLTF